MDDIEKEKLDVTCDIDPMGFDSEQLTTSTASSRTSESAGTLGPQHEEESFSSSDQGDVVRQPVNKITSKDVKTTYADHVIDKRLLEYGIVRQERRRRPSTRDSVSSSVKHAVDEVHRWLFVEGGHFDSVQAIMTNYCNFVRELGIPVDRQFLGGLGIHPKLTAYLWKWEPDDFSFREMPEEVFKKRWELFSPDEPFCVLEQGKEDEVRIKNTATYIPPDTEKWFREGKYVDYFALPDIHRDKFKGALAWATKHPDGFSDDHISFFRLTLPALTTVMRLHTNELVLHTLTERMELEIEERTLELEEANKSLAEANEAIGLQAKKQLQHFACMSHEIRTPLNCIVGLSSLLLDSPEGMPPDVLESVQMMHSSADLLTAVVNDVLDYSKLESGVFDVDIRPSSLQETLNAVVHAMTEKAAQREVRILTFLSPTLPDQICTDARRLQQVLFNLLGNACKFSKIGNDVELCVSLVSKTEKESPDDQSSQLPWLARPKMLRFAVKDYGKGIERKDFESIFEPFNQASRKTLALYGGTGLGLSITSALVDRLGGTISVDSEVGEFAEFAVELPFDGAPVAVNELASKFTKTRIITLEDAKVSESSSFDVTGLFLPSVIQEYNLNVVKAQSWGDVCELIDDGSDRTSEGFHSLVVLPGSSSSKDVTVTEEMKIATTRLMSRQYASTDDGSCTWSLFTIGNPPIPGETPVHVTSLPSLKCLLPSYLLEHMARHLDTLPKVGNCHGEPSDPSYVNASPLTCTDGVEICEGQGTGMPPGCIQSTPPSLEAKSGATSLGDVGNLPAALDLASKDRPDKPLIQPLRILIAEDNLVNQKVLTRVLHKLGLDEIDIVDNGQKALDATTKVKYDVIFMDMQMPVMDGLAATRLIKERDAKDEGTLTQDTKIIFCTAHAIDDYRQQAEEAGGDGFVSKPFNLKRISSALELLLLEDGKPNAADLVGVESIHRNKVPDEAIVCKPPCADVVVGGRTSSSSKSFHFVAVVVVVMMVMMVTYLSLLTFYKSFYDYMLTL